MAEIESSVQANFVQLIGIFTIFLNPLHGRCNKNDIIAGAKTKRASAGLPQPFSLIEL